MVKENYFFRDSFEKLCNEFEKGKQIVLFLGAGINISDGNGLGWDSLLNYLFKKALSFISIENNIDNSISLEEICKPISEEDFCTKQESGNVKLFLVKEYPSLVKASIIKSVLGDNYVTSIQEYIYSRCNKEKLESIFKDCYVINECNREINKKPYYSLFQTAKLIMLCQNVKAVVTYNYDNLLSDAIRILSKDPKLYFSIKEQALIEAQKRIPKDVSSTNLDSELVEGIFPIYHVHGYIPPPNELIIKKSNDIVLTMEEFYDSMGNVFSWQTSTPIHFLNNYTTVFLGLSLTDLNTQRMIRFVQNENKKRSIYYLYASDAINNLEIYGNLLKVKKTFYQNYGLIPVLDLEGYLSLYSRFDKIINNLIQK